MRTLDKSVAALAVALASLTVQAQQNTQIEPEAITALENMGEYLRSLKAFQVHAVTTSEQVLQDGQKIQFAGVADGLARLPDRLRISIDGERRDRLYVYDGQFFTALTRGDNYYATVPAPPTIAELVDKIREKHGLDLPLADLFWWGSQRSKEADIKSAMVVGPAEIGGVTCGHYAFRQDGLDWQIWIQMGDHPLPRKVVLTTLTDEARPQYTAVYTWNLAPSFNETAFTFIPPKGASRVVLAKVE